jgi:hypothetical protein
MTIDELLARPDLAYVLSRLEPRQRQAVETIMRSPERPALVLQARYPGLTYQVLEKRFQELLVRYCNQRLLTMKPPLKLSDFKSYWKYGWNLPQPRAALGS